MSIKAVTFDLWATLLGNPARGGAARHQARIEALVNALEARGDTVDQRDVDRVMRREWKHYNRVWRDEERTMLNDERLAWMLEVLGLEPLDDATTERVCTAFDESIWAGPPGIADGAVACVEALAEAEIRMGVISDTSYTTGATMRELLERTGIMRHLVEDALVFSDEVGFSKPREDAFTRALEGLGLDPRDPDAAGRVAHIGDNPHTDVHGANEAGLRSVLYKPDPDRELELVAEPWRVVQHFDELVELVI